MFLFGPFEDKGLLESRQLRFVIEWKDPEKTPENDKILKTILNFKSLAVQQHLTSILLSLKENKSNIEEKGQTFIVNVSALANAVQIMMRDHIITFYINYINKLKLTKQSLCVIEFC